MLITKLFIHYLFSLTSNTLTVLICFFPSKFSRNNSNRVDKQIKEYYRDYSNPVSHDEYFTLVSFLMSFRMMMMQVRILLLYKIKD